MRRFRFQQSAHGVRVRVQNAHIFAFAVYEFGRVRARLEAVKRAEQEGHAVDEHYVPIIIRIITATAAAATLASRVVVVIIILDENDDVVLVVVV
jgi:hypothetical protein